ncbi:MAG: hypothetical protein FWG55_05790 [Candidatus Bathyarchaeota archaeon]|nr:hypothetical protein [Candidatus Termiticorpusculum sp.]
MLKQAKNQKDVILNCRKTYNSLTQLIKTVNNHTIKENLRDMRTQVFEIEFAVKNMETQKRGSITMQSKNTQTVGTLLDSYQHPILSNHRKS